jgi:hypothetical protein
MELPILREKGTLTLQEINAQRQSLSQIPIALIHIAPPFLNTDPTHARRLPVHVGTYPMMPFGNTRLHVVLTRFPCKGWRRSVTARHLSRHPATRINVRTALLTGAVACSCYLFAVRSSIVAGQDFLSQAALKDESRRAHSVASLTRLRALQASLEQANQEAKRAQHQTYVAEFQRMHERYGRNSDGTRKAVAAASAPAPTATAAAASDAASSGPTGAESSSATAAAAPTSSANEQPEAAPVASGAPELSSSSSSSSSSGETKVAATVKEDATAATPAAMAEAGSA